MLYGCESQALDIYHRIVPILGMWWMQQIWAWRWHWQASNAATHGTIDRYVPKMRAYGCDAGNKPSPRRQAALAKLHPGGLTDDWADKLTEEGFTSSNQRVTHEHFSQVSSPCRPLPQIDPLTKMIGV